MQKEEQEEEKTNNLFCCAFFELFDAFGHQESAQTPLLVCHCLCKPLQVPTLTQLILPLEQPNNIINPTVNPVVESISQTS